MPQHAQQRFSYPLHYNKTSLVEVYDHLGQLYPSYPCGENYCGNWSSKPEPIVLVSMAVVVTLSMLSVC